MELLTPRFQAFGACFSAKIGTFRCIVATAAFGTIAVAVLPTSHQLVSSAAFAFTVDAASFRLIG